MVRDISSRSSWPRKHCPTSFTKGFSTTTPMGTTASLDDRVNDSLHIDGGKIGISQVFRDILGLRSRLKVRYEQRNVGTC